MKHKDMWRALHKHEPQLSFSKSQLQAKTLWKRALTANEKKDFKRHIAERIRCMARHIDAARTNNAKTKWIVKLLHGKEEANEG